MCGIVGAVNVEHDICLKMLHHQHKRGPDDTGWILKDGVFLGHNRLSILDLSKSGNQPMTKGKYTLVYNGEIYNYREMQSYLHADDDAGHHKGGNDAWTLLHYIHEYGLKDALQITNGMYAYCSYDAVLKQIHLVVDRFGQKPLYYYHSGATFVFASTPAALLQLKDKWSINEEALQSYWLLGSVMGEDSMWSGIRKLTGSHHLIYDIQKNEVKIERYWTPKFQDNTSGIEDLILDSIRKTLVADVPVYVFLSGGIDSTLVASQCSGMNAVHLNGPEYTYAKRAADRFGMKLLQVNPEEIQVEKSLQDFAFQFGEPCMAALIPYITAKEVSKYAKVAISANAADELFFGYDRTYEGITEKQLNHIFRMPLKGKHFVFDFYGQLWGEDRPGTGRWWELQSYVQYDLNKTLDAASMCHSLEVRSPFLDHRLVEMALSIPEGKHIDMRLGRKAILKRMLQRMGFDHEFLTRPKQGFSLFSEPKDLESLKFKAWQFVKQNGFLKCDDNKLTGRDKKYLEMSALSFWQWYQTWGNKL